MSINHKSIPALTTVQMIEVDRAMIEDYHIELIQMMENAGRNFAEMARHQMGGMVKDRNVVVMCGNGGNGGGGMTTARHLHNWGAQVIVALTKSADEYRGVPAHQLDFLKRMNIPIVDSASLPSTPDLILVGQIERAGIYQTLIREKADVSALRRELLGPRFHYGHYILAQPRKMDRYVTAG